MIGQKMEICIACITIWISNFILNFSRFPRAINIQYTESGVRTQNFENFWKNEL